MISYDAEHLLRDRGLVAIGVDEAGRGALAGPVVAAAVVLSPECIPSGIDDSKKLRPHQREVLAQQIRSCALAWAVGLRSPNVIDEINILQATFEAMHEAIDACLADLGRPFTECHLLIDGNRFRPHAIAHTAIVGGDTSSLTIAAASILAKTYRDSLMVTELDCAYPVYGFSSHKGYGTQQHRDALHRHGPCPEHRRSFLGGVLSRRNDVSGAADGWV